MGDSPEPLVTVALIVAGAGVSGAIGGAVKKFAPQIEIAPDIIGAVAGGALYLFGGRIHPLLKAFGVGVLAGSLKGTIEKAIPAGLGGAPAAAPAAPTGTSASAAARARYGIR